MPEVSFSCNKLFDFYGKQNETKPPNQCNSFNISKWFTIFSFWTTWRNYFMFVNGHCQASTQTTSRHA